MNREQRRSQPETAEDQTARHPEYCNLLTIYNLSFFLVFLGLFNPPLWVSVHAGKVCPKMVRDAAEILNEILD